MARHTPAEDLLAMIAQRRAVLECVRERDGVTSKQTLLAALDLTRPTIEKVVRELCDVGLLEEKSDGITPTLVATLVHDEYRTFIQQLAAIESSDHENTPLWPTEADRQEVMSLVAARRPIIECIETTPHDKRDLVANLDVSRSTVDRAIRKLEVAELVAWNTDGYTATPAGRHAVAKYCATIATISDILAAQDVLAALPRECPIEPALLTGADVEYTADAAPYHLPAGIRDRIAAADRVRVCLSTLATPLLLDCCHRGVVQDGLTLEVLTNPELFETLTADFPGPLADMATDSACTINVIDAVAERLPSFGLVLTDSEGQSPSGNRTQFGDTETATTASVITYSDRGTIQGTIHNGTADAVQWAESCYTHAHKGTRDVTDTVSSLASERTESAIVGASTETDTGLTLEADGFVQLTPEYFTQRAPAPPITAWRTGFDLVDVHAGYAIGRETERDGSRQPLVDDILAGLSDGTDHALIGGPGSGKSTVCKTVACRWYEQGRGTVFYRTSGRGTTFDSPAVLSAHLREADGHVLVIIEDAVRAEANAVFRVMRRFRGDEHVTFLVDSRTGEWEDPPTFPTDARLDAYRTESIETVTIPALDESEVKRLIRHFQDTTDHEINVSVPTLLRGNETDADETPESQPANLLFVLHRLTLTADPLAREETQTPTTLTEDVQQTYADLRADGEVALDVGILVNILNATGLGVQPALVYALAETDEEIRTVRTTLSSLEGHLIFPYESNDDSSYRAVHESWSELFLDTLLDTAEALEASRRFGRCVSTLLSLADNESQRERSTIAISGDAPRIEQIATAPTEWADETTDRLFQLGLDRPGLAPLFGTTDISPIELPDACSPAMDSRCAERRGRMYYYNSNHEQAERDFSRTVQLVETADTSETASLRSKARSQKNLGLVAFRRGNLDTAVDFFTSARASYRNLSGRIGEAACHGNLGIVAGQRGDLVRAIAYFERSLSTHREVGTPGQQRIAPLNDLAMAASRRGNFVRAETYIERSITLSREFNEHFLLSLSLASLGTINHKRGDLNQSEDSYNRAITIAQETGYRIGKATGLAGLAEISIERGNLDQAEKSIQRCLDISREIENKVNIALGQRHLGTIARKRGDYNEAETHLSDALTKSRESDGRYEEARTLVALGNLAHDQDRPAQARDRFSDAVENYRDMGAVRDVIETLERLGEICEALDETEAALTHYEAATDLVNETEFVDPRESLTERRGQLAESHMNDSSE